MELAVAIAREEGGDVGAAAQAVRTSLVEAVRRAELALVRAAVHFFGQYTFAFRVMRYSASPMSVPGWHALHAFELTRADLLSGGVC